MKNGNTILKNTVFLASGKAIGDLFTFFFLVYFARMFGTDILGKYAFAMAIGGGLSVFVTFGLNTLVIRDVSRNKELTKRYLFNLLLVQGVLSIFIGISIVLIALVLPVDPESKIIVVIIGTYHVFYRMAMLLQSFFRAHEEMQYSGFLEAFHKIVILALGLSTVVVWNNAIITLSVYPLSALIMFAMAIWFFISRYGRLNVRVDIQLIKTLVGEAMPFLAMMIVCQISLRLGIILLTFFHGESATGVYAAGDRLITTIAVGVQFFGSALLPAMSRLSVVDREAALKVLEHSIRFMLITILPLCTMLFLMRGPAVIILFGPEFSDSIPVFGICSWSILFVGLNMLLSGLFIVYHGQRQLLKLETVTAIGYGVLCLILIPKQSYTGLAYARLFTESVLFAGTYIFVRISYCSLPILKMAARPSLSCVSTILAFYLLNGINFWIAIVSAGTVCIATMFLFKAVHISDFKFSKEMLFTSDVAKQEDRTMSVSEDLSQRSQAFGVALPKGESKSGKNLGSGENVT